MKKLFFAALLYAAPCFWMVPCTKDEKMEVFPTDEDVAYTRFTYSGGHGIPGEHLEEAIAYIKDFLQ
ncbi:hypothetical protein [Parapedobacter defluvii]|nr:hypothetical protein [Parapedobacter defluvii]